MDYSRIYHQLIQRASTRTEIAGYVEKHHVIPRCRGGSNDSSNIVVLTPEEHFVAHQLLVKMYPNDYKIALAARMMCLYASHQTMRRTNRWFGWLKRSLHRATILDTEARTSRQRWGSTNNFYGKRHTAYVKQYLSEKARERWSTPEGQAVRLQQASTMREISGVLNLLRGKYIQHKYISSQPHTYAQLFVDIKNGVDRKVIYRKYKHCGPEFNPRRLLDIMRRAEYFQEVFHEVVNGNKR